MLLVGGATSQSVSNRMLNSVTLVLMAKLSIALIVQRYLNSISQSIYYSGKKTVGEGFPYVKKCF